MNNHSLEVLFARRPKLEYVCPAICESVFSSTSFPSLVLEPLPTKPKIQGIVFTYTGEGGDFQLTWNNYPGAICYSVYKTNDATDPFGEYRLIAECISDPVYHPQDWELFPPEEGCYLITAITPEGETPFSEPVCNFVAAIIPEGPLDALVGEIYSQDLALIGLPEAPTDVSWSLTDGALPVGLTLDSLTGQISGVVGEAGVFNFTVTVAGLSAGAIFAAQRSYQLTATTTTPELDFVFTNLFGNAEALTSAVINGMDFLGGNPTDGQHMGNSFVVDWTVNGMGSAGYTIAFQGVDTISSGEAGNYRFSANNLLVMPQTLNVPRVRLLINEIEFYSYDLSTQTGLGTLDFSVNEGDVARVEFAVDGQSAPVGTYHTTFDVTAIPAP